MGTRIGGAVDVATLRKRLHGEIISDAHLPPAGWTRLLRLNEEARSVVGRTLAGLGSAAALTLPRKSVRDGLSNALALPGDILVKGDSGVGKSAIVMDAIEPAVLGGDNRQALAINLRHLPDTPLELLDMLISPVEELFSELTAPDCLLVIDGAEAAAERHGQMFSHVLRYARSAGLRVVAISATEGSGAVTELMKSGANVPREYVVPGGLDDEDIATAGVHLPALQRLIDNPRARELLRRPIVVELLSRAGDPGLPLTDSEALGHIWERLVRNGGDGRTLERRTHGNESCCNSQLMQSINATLTPSSAASTMLQWTILGKVACCYLLVGCHGTAYLSSSTTSFAPTPSRVTFLANGIQPKR